jgi:hypothetical protein
VVTEISVGGSLRTTIQYVVGSRPRWARLGQVTTGTDTSAGSASRGASISLSVRA